MTPEAPAQPPDAPESDVRLTEAEREAVLRAHVHISPRDLLAAVERIVAERVRVVEGERDAAEFKFEHAHKGANLYRARAESAEAAHEALRKGIEALADDFASNVDWSNGRSNYGDNEAWESAARQIRALLVGGAS